MGPAHLDGYLSEGTYRSFSSITDDTDDRESGSLKLWYAVDVKCIGPRFSHNISTGSPW